MQGYASDGDYEEPESPRPESPEPDSPRPCDNLEGGNGGARRQLIAFSQPGLLQTSQRYRQLNRQARDLTTEISQQIDQETAAERRAAEQALEALRHKRQELLRRADIRGRMQQQQQYADELEDIGDELKMKLRKLVRSVMREESLTDEQKMEMVEEAHRRAAFALMDEDEQAVVEQLQNVISSMPCSKGNVRQMVRLR